MIWHEGCTNNEVDNHACSDTSAQEHVGRDDNACYGNESNPRKKNDRLPESQPFITFEKIFACKKIEGV